MRHLGMEVDVLVRNCPLQMGRRPRTAVCRLVRRSMTAARSGGHLYQAWFWTISASSNDCFWRRPVIACDCLWPNADAQTGPAVHVLFALTFEHCCSISMVSPLSIVCCRIWRMVVVQGVEAFDPRRVGKSPDRLAPRLSEVAPGACEL